VQRVAWDRPPLHPTQRHRSAERAFRRLITDGEFAEPDEVEYTETTVVFLWHATKLAVVVDLEEPLADAA
jgi:hypothetical protein